MDGTTSRRDGEGLKLEKESDVASADDLSAEQRAILDTIEAKALRQTRFPLIDRPDAEAIAQHTKVAMWRRLTREPRLWSKGAERERDKLQFKITANAIVSLRRHAEAMRKREGDEEVDLDSLPSDRPSQHDEIEEREFFHCLARGLQKLKTRTRQIWCLHYLDEWKPAVIAPLFRMKVRAVCDALFRANLAIRPFLIAGGYRNEPESQP